jgi:hypothetical protein
VSNRHGSTVHESLVLTIGASMMAMKSFDLYTTRRQPQGAKAVLW